MVAFAFVVGVGVGVGGVVGVGVAVAFVVGVGVVFVGAFVVGVVVAMKAADFLSQVALIVRERGEVYGDARANLSDTAARWSATLGHKVTPAQVCLCMVDLKMSRLKASPQHLDSLQDICGYVALLSEIITE